MSALVVVLQVVGAVSLGSLVLALVLGAVMAVNGRVDAREVLEVALGECGAAGGPRGRSTGEGTRTGRSGGVLDLRLRLSPPPR